MQMIPVCSSNLVAVGYDNQTATLRIQFNYGMYDYHNVPVVIFHNLLNSPSKGRFHAKFIKNQYPYHRV